MNFKEACKKAGCWVDLARRAKAREKFFKKVGKELICLDYNKFKEHIDDYNAHYSDHMSRKLEWNYQELECVRNYIRKKNCKCCSVNFIKNCQMKYHIIDRIDKAFENYEKRRIKCLKN